MTHSNSDSAERMARHRKRRAEGLEYLRLDLDVPVGLAEEIRERIPKWIKALERAKEKNEPVTLKIHPPTCK